MYPIVRYLGFWIIGIIVQVWGKCMIIRYLDPLGFRQKLRSLKKGSSTP